MSFSDFYQLYLENSAVRSYSCLMLDCSDVQNELVEFQKQICSCDIYDEEPGMGLESDAHITALYGITSNKLHEVTDKVKLYPCKFKLTGLSLFKQDKYDVLKFDVQSKDLHALNKDLRENISYTNSYPNYIPHMTCFYAKAGMGKKYTNKKCPLIGQEFTSNRFVFSDAIGNKTDILV